MYLFLQIERERKWKREGVSEGEYVCSHIPKMSEEKDKSSLDRQAALPQYLHQHHSNNHHHNRHLEVPFLERSMNHLTKTNYEQMKIAVRCRRIDRILYKYLFFLAISFFVVVVVVGGGGGVNFLHVSIIYIKTYRTIIDSRACDRKRARRQYRRVRSSWTAKPRSSTPYSTIRNTPSTSRSAHASNT